LQQSGAALGTQTQISFVRLLALQSITDPAAR